MLLNLVLIIVVIWKIQHHYLYLIVWVVVIQHRQTKDLKECWMKCGTKNKPVSVPLPDCVDECYTTSTDKDALKSCSKNCGTKKNQCQYLYLIVKKIVIQHLKVIIFQMKLMYLKKLIFRRESYVLQEEIQ